MRNRQRTPLQFKKQLCQMQRPEQSLAIDAALWFGVYSHFTVFTHPYFTFVNYWILQGRIAGLKSAIFSRLRVLFRTEHLVAGFYVYTVAFLPTPV